MSSPLRRRMISIRIFSKEARRLLTGTLCPTTSYDRYKIESYDIAKRIPHEQHRNSIFTATRLRGV